MRYWLIYIVYPILQANGSPIKHITPWRLVESIILLGCYIEKWNYTCTKDELQKSKTEKKRINSRSRKYVSEV